MPFLVTPSIQQFYVFFVSRKRKHSFFWNLLKYSSNAVLKLKDQFLRVLRWILHTSFREEGDILYPKNMRSKLRKCVIWVDFLFFSIHLICCFLLRESIDLGDGLNIWLHLWIGGCRKSFSIIFSSNLGKNQKFFCAKGGSLGFPRVVEVRKHLALNRYDGRNTILLHHFLQKAKFKNSPFLTVTVLSFRVISCPFLSYRKLIQFYKKWYCERSCKFLMIFKDFCFGLI